MIAFYHIFLKVLQIYLVIKYWILFHVFRRLYLLLKTENHRLVSLWRPEGPLGYWLGNHLFELLFLKDLSVRKSVGLDSINETDSAIEKHISASLKVFWNILAHLHPHHDSVLPFSHGDIRTHRHCLSLCLRWSQEAVKAQSGLDQNGSTVWSIFSAWSLRLSKSLLGKKPGTISGVERCGRQGGGGGGSIYSESDPVPLSVCLSVRAHGIPTAALALGSDSDSDISGESWGSSRFCPALDLLVRRERNWGVSLRFIFPHTERKMDWMSPRLVF